MTRIRHIPFLFVLLLKIFLCRCNDGLGPQYIAWPSIADYPERYQEQIQQNGDWQIRGSNDADFKSDPLSIGVNAQSDRVFKFKVCKDAYSDQCKRFMNVHTPFVICVKMSLSSGVTVSTNCPINYFEISFTQTNDEEIFSVNLLQNLVEFNDGCLYIAIYLDDKKNTVIYFGDSVVIFNVTILQHDFQPTMLGNSPGVTEFWVFDMYVYSPNPTCGLWFSPLDGQPLVNAMIDKHRKRNIDDASDDETTKKPRKQKQQSSNIWIYVVVGVTAVISLIALPFVVRILYLEICAKNKNNPPAPVAPVTGQNGSGGHSSGGDGSGKATAEMSNATDNGSKDPFVKEESKKKENFIGPKPKESKKSEKKPKKTEEPPPKTAKKLTVVPPPHAIDDGPQVQIHKRFHTILPTRKRLQRGPDEMHRMSMVEEDPDKRHDYLNEAIHNAEIEVDWVINDHNTNKKKSPTNHDNMSHIGKRIIEARRRHIRPPIQCRKGDFRNEYLFPFEYSQVYDFALTEEYDLQARYFYFEYALSEVKNRFEDWAKNKANFDPCSVDPLILQYDLAVEEKQKNYNGELSQIGWDSAPLVHVKRTREAIVPPSAKGPK